MTETMIVGILSLLGTLVGSLGGIMASNKLVTFRLEQLEIKVNKHNNLIERMAVVERDLKTAFNKIDDLKGEVHHEH